MVKDNSLSSRVMDIVVTVTLVTAAILCLLPLWYTLSLSFSDKAAAAAGRVGLWPVGFNTLSYQSILSDANFLNAFWISVQRVVLGTLAELTITLMMAYPLSKTIRQFPPRNIIMWFLVLASLPIGLASQQRVIFVASQSRLRSRILAVSAKVYTQSRSTALPSLPTCSPSN